MENHAEEKPHRCPKCPASFNIPVSLFDIFSIDIVENFKNKLKKRILKDIYKNVCIYYQKNIDDKLAISRGEDAKYDQ